MKHLIFIVGAVLLVVFMVVAIYLSKNSILKKVSMDNNQAITELAPVDAPVNPTANQPDIFKVAAIGATTDDQFVAQYPSAILHTSLGDITVKFYGADSPKTVANFIKLSLIKFYDNTRFHRVIKDFMIQGGDPNSKDEDPSNDGTGGPGYQFADEFNTHKLVLGSLAMANSGPNTNGSQFFIVTAKETPWLDGKHVNFGEVTSGLDVLTKIGNIDTDVTDHPIINVTLKSVELLKK